MAAVAKDLRVVVIASLFERAPRGVHHNTAVILDADGRAAVPLPNAHPGRPLYYEVLLRRGPGLRAP
jgi:N-carbamoylputrescine amidase